MAGKSPCRHGGFPVGYLLVKTSEIPSMTGGDEHPAIPAAIFHVSFLSSPVGQAPQVNVAGNRKIRSLARAAALVRDVAHFL